MCSLADDVPTALISSLSSAHSYLRMTMSADLSIMLHDYPITFSLLPCLLPHRHFQLAHLIWKSRFSVSSFKPGRTIQNAFLIDGIVLWGIPVVYILHIPMPSYEDNLKGTA